jgi:Tol biopolymer transport system component/tRNA A-37 threonylcarbamoyl transferase component Bud32
MSLSIGEKLGPYEILAPIGAGGMGEVYKANDTRLDRIVAIKTSRTEFSERFEREARAVAALNHPNICHLYDVGPNYLVMEYIEGTPLRCPLPLDQALKFAAQICDALDAAHKKGITHRDLKPANILVTRQGIKLLDFGLAQLSASAQKPLDDATFTKALTGKNEIVGTLFYMSPEQLQWQATGREIDGRSDIFSFGLVLYEMLTGKRAFDGASSVSVIAAIIERSAPSITHIAPPALERVLQKCLAKDPDERWQSARDLKDELQWIAGQSSSQTVPGSASTSPALRWKAGLAAAVLVLAGGLGWMGRSMFWGARAGAGPTTNTTLEMPDQTTAGFLALSPDGQTLAFNLLGAQGGLALRPLGSDQFRLLAGTYGARTPFWSADGKNVAFLQDGKLKYVSASGGPAQELCSGIANGGTWNQDNVILVGTYNGELLKTAASGGGCTPMPGDPAFSRRSPYFLPDGKHFLYEGLPSGPDLAAASKTGVYVASLDDPAGGRRLLPDDSNAVFAQADSSGGGYLLFLRDDALMAQAFNSKTLEVSGEVFKIADGVSIDQSARIMVAAAPNGVLVYGTGRSPASSQMLWLDRTGKPLAPAGPIVKQVGVALSPNGRQVAATRQEQISQIWLGEATGGAVTGDNESRLTNEPLGGATAVWSPDGKIVVFTGRDGNLHRKDASGGGNEELLLKSGNFKYASDWSRDGRFLFYTEVDASTQGDIWVLPNPLGAAGESKPYPFLQTAADESEAQLSPDGRWVAYTSNESGHTEVYVRPFPTGEGRWKVSVKGGGEPRWRGDGRELFYTELPSDRQQAGAGLNFMAAPVTGGANGSFVAGKPLPLFSHALRLRNPDQNAFSYAVSADGQRFLVLSKPDVQESVHVLTNWTQQMEKK